MSFQVLLVRPLAGCTEARGTYDTLEELASRWKLPYNNSTTLAELEDRLNESIDWDVDDQDDLVHLKIVPFPNGSQKPCRSYEDDWEEDEDEEVPGI